MEHIVRNAYEAQALIGKAEIGDTIRLQLEQSFPFRDWANQNEQPTAYMEYGCSYHDGSVFVCPGCHHQVEIKQGALVFPQQPTDRMPVDSPAKP